MTARYLRILPEGHVPNTVLSNLERLTVLCGKNNAGKTTLLRAVNSADRIEVGWLFDDNACAEFAKRYTQQTGFEQSAQATRAFHDTCGAFLEDLVKPYFESSLDPVIQGLPRVWSQNGYGRLGIDSARLEATFRSFIPRKPRTVLIDPKRALSAQVPNMWSIDPIPSGNGVIERLFRQKNAAKDDTEQARFANTGWAFKEISKGCEFDIVALPKNQLEVRFRDRIGKWIDAENSGLGLREILLMVFWCFEPTVDMLLIEEPENHLHPETQSRLAQFFSEIQDKQIILSTHSPTFASTRYADRQFWVNFDDGRIKCEDSSNFAVVLQNLGFSLPQIASSDTLILVEGATDIGAVGVLLDKLGVTKKKTVFIWPMQGDSMDHLDIQPIKSKFDVKALVDRDPKSAAVRRRFIKKCEALGIPVCKLKRTALENYFSIDSYRTVFPGKIPDSLVEINPDMKVEEQIGLNPKNSNAKLAKQTDIESIRNTDLIEFLEKI
jgi:energy-coupling factor transporter ATP-binding protein EcfA2